MAMMEENLLPTAGVAVPLQKGTGIIKMATLYCVETVHIVNMIKFRFQSQLPNLGMELESGLETLRQ